MLRWGSLIIVVTLTATATADDQPSKVQELEAAWRAKLEATREDSSHSRDLAGALNAYVPLADGERSYDAVTQSLRLFSSPSYQLFCYGLMATCSYNFREENNLTRSRQIALDFLEKTLGLSLGENPGAGLIKSRGKTEALLRSQAFQSALEIGLLEVALTEWPALEEAFERLEPTDGRRTDQLPRLRSRFLLFLERYDELERVNREALESTCTNDTKAYLLYGLAIAALEREKIGQSPSPSAIDYFKQGLEFEKLHQNVRIDLREGLTIALWRSGNLQSCRASLKQLEADAEALTKTNLARSQEVMETVAAVRFQVEQRDGTASAREATRSALLQLWELRLESWRNAPLRAFGRGLFQSESRRRFIEATIDATLGQNPDSAVITDALQVLVDAQSCGTLSRRLAAPGLEISPQWLAQQPPRSGILAYFPGADQSHVFAIDRSSITHHRIGSRDELIVDQDVFFRSVVLPPQGKGSESWRDVARRVAVRLIPQEIEARFDSWDQLTLIDTGVFEDVLFEYLILSDGKELGQRIALTHAPSLGVLELLRQRHSMRKTAPKILSLVASGVESEATVKHKLAPLPESMNWSNRLFSAFEPSCITELEGEDSRLEPFSELAADHRLAQILCHGVSDFTREDPAQLAWSPSDAHPTGLVSSKDLAGSQFPPFTLLTTCGGARTTPRRGDPNANDLPGAILEAGSSVVVASSAQLPTEETLEISAAIHRSLAKGLSLAEAMRRIRIDRARRQPHPYDRGLLQVFGAGHLAVFGPDELDQVSSRRQNPGVLLGVFFATVAVLAIFRRRNRSNGPGPA